MVIFRDVSELKALQREIIRTAEDEQCRIGQELHDSTGQELLGLGLLADNLAETLAERALPEAKMAARISRSRSVRL